MTVTETNITGVRDFDHLQLAGLAEYHEARAAIDKLCHAMNAATVPGTPVTHAEWIEVVSDFARSNAYADCCASCRSTGDFAPVFPAKVELDGERGLKGSYVCPTCRTTWTCWYSIDAPDQV